MSVIYRALNKVKSTASGEPPTPASEGGAMPPSPPSSSAPSSLWERHKKPMILSGVALLLSVVGALLITWTAPKPEKPAQPPTPPAPTKPEVQSRPALPKTMGSSEGAKGLPLPTTSRVGLSPTAVSSSQPQQPSVGGSAPLPPAITAVESAGLPPPLSSPAPAPSPTAEEEHDKMPTVDPIIKKSNDPLIIQSGERPRRDDRR
ncbi:MAG: hypothetical protein G8345_06415, partial [Magnetococcales bacterium]|nr:hypothetical protein [Magnetococcales bacterium]